MDEMLKKQDVLDAIYATMEKTDKPDVVLGLAAAMSVVKKMEALEQEPCINAISRQAVLDLAKFDGRENLGSIIHAFDVEQLPPVKPAEKMGHWISIGDFECRCSECQLWCYKRNRSRYCPSCGAKMED